MIDSYSIEAQNSDKTWQVLYSIHSQSGPMYFGSDPARVRRLEVESVSFDVALQNRNIAPKDTVTGWIFLDGGKNIVEPNFPFRIKLREVNGAEWIVPIQDTSNTAGSSVQRGEFKAIEEETDISRYPRGAW